MKKWMVTLLLVLLTTLLICCGKDDFSERNKQFPNDGVSKSVIKSIEEKDANERAEVKKNLERNESPKKEKTTKDINKAPIAKESSKSSIKSQKNEKNPPKDSKKNTVVTTKKPSNSKKDKYSTDPVPKDKPKPVEPEDTKIIPSKKLTAKLSIACDTILNNMEKFNKDKLSVLPKDGVIMKTRTVEFSEGESVLDVLKRETRESKIHMEMEFFPAYNSAYIEGINNIYEFDCGELSGWMYKVNGWFPNYGSSRYLLKDGDVIEWVYTCDLGRDVGGYVEGVENQ